MGHIQDRWYKKVVDSGTKSVSRVKTGLYGKGMRYKVRYLDPDGRELSKMYPDRQLSAAKAFLHEVESTKQRGTYLNPHSGKVTFQSYADEWLKGQSFKSTTRGVVPSRLKNQVYPFLGNIELGSITPTTIRNWIRWMLDRGTAPNYRLVCFTHVSAIFSAAIDDKKIATNPCQARSALGRNGASARSCPGLTPDSRRSGWLSRRKSQSRFHSGPAVGSGKGKCSASHRMMSTARP
jgi:hypothetical protein